MPAPVFILGGARSDFARSLTEGGRSLADRTRDALHAALADARLDLADVGDAFGELFTGQADLGLADAARQVTHAVGDCSSAGAERILTFNLGGSTTTSVCFVVERDPA